MEQAVARLLAAIDREEPIGLYADRDVDGLAGLTLLVRTLRTLGGRVHWACPVLGRGVEHAALERLVAAGCKTVIFVDCGGGDAAELEWLLAQSVDIIVADHHRLAAASDAIAWIHPATVKVDGYHPAGCVMAFKVAQALWQSFLGTEDRERLDYFLYDHLDILALGILADRVPLTGENRTYVWHGLRRLHRTRKTGLQKLLRFFRLIPRTSPVTVREASWQLIPLLNAAGRLHRPERAAELLLTEDSMTASACLDDLLAFNTQRRLAQDASQEEFEKLIASQCDVATDAVLVALAEGLEPTVTGLAAQALARQFNRPAFLFVRQGDHAVGSVRGLDDADLYAWVERHQDVIVKFGGHAGAVGLTIRAVDFSVLRERLLSEGPTVERLLRADVRPEARLAIHEATLEWWTACESLGPFGPGFEVPLFELTGVMKTEKILRSQRKQVSLAAGGSDTVWARPVATPKAVIPFEWKLEEEQPTYAEASR